MKKSIFAVILILSAFWMTSAYSAEYATFEALYKESSAIGWIAAGVVALIFGAAIFFSWGTATPFVAGIGTWVGGLMGFHGVVATNAGLALLGGGSIAAGGFGMIGGLTVLTAALSFSTDVIIDATIGKITSEYSYSKLAEESKNMTTLPIPKNTSGPDSYEEAMEILEEFNKDQSISSDHNQSVIRRAIGIMDSTDDGSLDDDERAKKFSLYALLHFLINDYKKAKVYARQAIGFSKYDDIKRTLPAFIYATSSLYDEKLDYQEIKDNFRYAVLEEPENPLIPLLFSVYLDRVMMRIDDRTLDADALKRVFLIGNNSKLSEHHPIIYTSLLSRYFIRLKVEQQLISSFAMQANNPSIQKIADKILTKLKYSHNEYQKLLKDAKTVSTALLNSDLKDQESRQKASEFYSLYSQYAKDEHRLDNLVKDFAEKTGQNNNYDNYAVFRFKNKCKHSIKLLISYKDTNQTWRTYGWWNVEENEDIFLVDLNNDRLKTDNNYWYSYAKTTDGSNIEWKGNYQSELFEGEYFPMMEFRDTDDEKDWVTTCD